MSKIELDNITSGYNLGKINANFVKIENALTNNVLFRDATGSTAGPNQMVQNIDMDSQSILNLPTPTEPTNPVRLQDLGDYATSTELTEVDNRLTAADTVLQNNINTESGLRISGDAILTGAVNSLDGRVTTLEQGTSGTDLYIHWLYNNGLALGGEVQLNIPYEFTSIATVYINGVRMSYGLAFDFDVAAKTVQLAEPLVTGDEVVVSLGVEPQEVSALVQSITEEVVLTDGQTVVTFVEQNTNGAAYYINGPSVDSRFLSSEDFTSSSTTNTTITLTESYPAGSIITLSKNVAGSGGIDGDIRREFVHNEPTLAVAVTSTLLRENDAINLRERTTGNGGGAMWDVVLSSSVTENGYNIVQCTGVPTLSLVLRQGVELYFSANELGLVADYEAGNTDQSAYLNAMIVAVFGSNAGILTFDGEFYFNGDVDYRNVGFDGLDKNTNRMFFDGAFGMLSTTPSQQAPKHKNLKLFSATERTANGQTLLSLLGKNYPRLSDVLIFGGENALLIEDGASVESHYGVFNSIDISRSHHGIRVKGGNRTQSHTFNGGRIWDCVESYVNMEGTADINFVGTQFEGDRAAQHLNAGASPDDAETKFYGCRDECDSYPDIQVGALLEDGVYWSGNKMPATQSVTSTEATELPNQIMIQGVRDDVAPTGINILRNPNFDVDPSDLNEVPAWVHLSGNVHEVQKGAFGNIVHIRGVNATERTAIFKQDGISVRKGWYTWGGTYERTGATSTFTTQLTLDGVALTAGVDFEGVAVNTTGTGKRINRIKFLRDIENIRFEFRVAAVNDADDLYYQQPFLVIGRHSQKTQIKNPLGFISASARATPITGWFNQGDVVYNLLPTELGSASSKYIVDGWKRIVTGNAHVLNTDWVELRVPTGN